MEILHGKVMNFKYLQMFFEIRWPRDNQLKYSTKSNPNDIIRINIIFMIKLLLINKAVLLR